MASNYEDQNESSTSEQTNADFKSVLFANGANITDVLNALENREKAKRASQNAKRSNFSSILDAFEKEATEKAAQRKMKTEPPAETTSTGPTAANDAMHAEMYEYFQSLDIAEAAQRGQDRASAEDVDNAKSRVFKLISKKSEAEDPRENLTEWPEWNKPKIPYDEQPMNCDGIFDDDEGHDGYVPGQPLVVDNHKLDMRCWDAFENNKHTDLTIKCGNFSLRCHKTLLKLHSSLFDDLDGECKILKVRDCHMNGKYIKAVYKYMMDPKINITMENFIELYYGCKVFEITRLQNVFSTILDRRDLLSEPQIFLLYVDAFKRGKFELARCLVSKICKFFLVAVASKEFLDLSLGGLVHLLCSNNIAVHSEIEVLYAGVRWMYHDFEKRKYSICVIASCIRWSLMPPRQLTSMQILYGKGDEVHNPEILSFVRFPRIQKVIRDHVTYILAKSLPAHKQCKQGMNAVVQELDMDIAEPRILIKDPGDTSTEPCQCFVYYSFKDFMTMLNFLSTADKDYYNSFVTVEYSKKCKHFKN